MGKKSSWAFGKQAILMPLFSSPCWNVNIRPESHLVSTIKIDGLHELKAARLELKCQLIGGLN